MVMLIMIVVVAGVVLANMKDRNCEKARGRALLGSLLFAALVVWFGSASAAEHEGEWKFSVTKTWHSKSARSELSNEIHPEVSYSMSENTYVGAYYNSRGRVSVYAAYDYVRPFGTFSIGLVTGYHSTDKRLRDKTLVVPMLKYEYKVDENLSILVVPSVTKFADRKTEKGIVLGIRYTF